MPGYQQPGPPGWPTGPGGSPGYAPTQVGPGGYAERPRRRPGLLTTAPALAASLAISVGVAGVFLANLFVALGAQNGTPGRDRLLQFLSPADLAVAAVLVLAVALVVWHRSEGIDAPEAAGPPARTVGLVAGVVAAAVAVGALLRGIVDLTVPHQHGAIKIGNLVDALAAALVAAVAALWGLRSRR